MRTMPCRWSFPGMRRAAAAALLAAAALAAVAPARAGARVPPGGGGGHGTGGGTVVTVPPSADALAAALAAAGSGGVVLLQAGLHTESGEVVISRPASIVGEAGAVLESAVPSSGVYPLDLRAALHVRGAAGVRIAGLTMRPPSGAGGGSAVLLEDAPSAVVGGNNIAGYQFGVMVERSNGVSIDGNRIAVDPGWTTGATPEAHGIVVIHGTGAQITDNSISGALFGIWMCDRDGTATGNTVTGSFIGLILCKVPEGNYAIGGAGVPAAISGADWDVRQNTAHDNQWGLLVIDGANGNRLSGNSAFRNAVYDIELTADTYRFGFLTPAAFDNAVSTSSGDKALLIKDCGNNNRITGPATLVDITADPCF